MRETFLELLRRYLRHDLSLDALEDWEAERFQSFAALPPEDATGRLWARWQSCLAELNAGHWDEEQCRAVLQQALDEVQTPTR
ncbi:MAG: hypothetical protein H0V51_04790 [Chloroflexi bacterium]|nr:hypothetical protein [Chloroflexota bacterium]